MAKKSAATNTQSQDTEHQENVNQHTRSHALKLKIEHLKTFQPLTDNQKKFFDAYRRGDYFIALLGSPGVGKCQGEDVRVNLMVPDDVYEKLITM